MKTSKRARHINQLVKSIVDAATGSAKSAPDEVDSTKNPAAVELGRKRGLKGGPARAKKLSNNHRSERAMKAARRVGLKSDNVIRVSRPGNASGIPAPYCNHVVATP
jgi:hypothetical protein